MDIFRLQSFCAVYELRSFSKAAEKLFISQPTVSSHIISLEQQLKHKLFDRVGKSVIPTQAGDIIYRYGKKALELIFQAETEVKFLSDEVFGDLKLGGSTIPACYILPRIISHYLNKYPKVNISLEVYDSKGVVERLVSGDLDIGVVGAIFDIGDLCFKKLICDQLVFIGNVRLLDAINSPEDITKVPFIMREKGSGTRKAIEMGLEKHGLGIGDLNIKAVVTTNEALLNLVLEGIGIGISSIFTVSHLKGIRKVEMREYPFFSFERNFYVVYHKNRTLYPVAKTFIERISEFFRDSYCL